MKDVTHCRDKDFVAEIVSETSGDLSQCAAQCKSERVLDKPLPVMIDDEKVTQVKR